MGASVVKLVHPSLPWGDVPRAHPQQQSKKVRAGLLPHRQLSCPSSARPVLQEAAPPRGGCRSDRGSAGPQGTLEPAASPLHSPPRPPPPPRKPNRLQEAQRQRAARDVGHGGQRASRDPGDWSRAEGGRGTRRRGSLRGLPPPSAGARPRQRACAPLPEKPAPPPPDQSEPGKEGGCG